MVTEEMIAERDVAAMRHLLTAASASELLCERVLFRSEVSARHTRATADGKLQLPRPNGAFAGRSFLCRAISTWNGLPPNDRQITRPRSADD